MGLADTVALSCSVRLFTRTWLRFLLFLSSFVCLFVALCRVWFQSGINFLAVKPSNLVAWEIKQDMAPGSSSLAVMCQRKASSTAERYGCSSTTCSCMCVCRICLLGPSTQNQRKGGVSTFTLWLILYIAWIHISAHQACSRICSPLS